MSSISSASEKHMHQMRFKQEVESMVNQFQVYENKVNQAAALVQVPVEDLMAIAQAKYESSPKVEIDQKLDSEKVIRDMFLLEVMTWFKTEFFSWVDSPSCPRCSKPTSLIGPGNPTADESLKSAGRVELYTCRSCFGDNREVARFPRYNNPVVLLETRKGRCGEWANCFALICRALGFEVRHVRDWTDHVWVEIFSTGQTPNRWVHVDPCENSYDNPLLYELGWGKKLNYVIAVSQDDIQDVTWRYTHDKNIQKVLLRRTLCEEKYLVESLLDIRKVIQASVQEIRKEVLKLRLIQELVEFLSPRFNQDPNNSEIVGRQSGSLAWRLARQEIGSSGNPDEFQWEINQDSVFQSQFQLSYDSVKDQYIMVKSNGKAEYFKGWEKGVFQAENIFRKEEHDWKMVYLARKEHSNSLKGKLSWVFRVSDPDISIRMMKLSALTSSFHKSANVRIILKNEKGLELNILDSSSIDGDINWSSQEMNVGQKGFAIEGSKMLTLIFEIQGGEGNNAWQHAQLFRRSTVQNNVGDDKYLNGLSVIIEIFKNTQL